jgi:CYTH domain-containing protein
MIELEKTYLAKYLPDNLADCESKEIIDIYIPASAEHPKLRIRKNGDKFEMTKKQPVNDGDASHQEEQTIILDKDEFDALNKLDGRRTHKIRYYFDFAGQMAEIDVFQDLLEGLVLVDFEFEAMEEKNSFEMPDFCLAEVTQEDFIAGGMICGKDYEDIEKDLEKFGYKKLLLE